MANTLTGLIPSLYSALDVVSRELVGIIPGVMRDATTERAAVGQTVRFQQVPAVVGENITPGQYPPSSGSQTIGYGELTITKARAFPVLWTGEEQKGLDNNGPGIIPVMRDQFAQMLRAVANEIETDLAALQITFSRAYGTAGATPFASTLGDPAQVKKILDDNGAPKSDRSLVINTTAGAALRTLAQLTKANEAGSTETLRRGTLLDIHGFSICESAQINTSVAGTGASATTDNAGYAVGATVLTLASAGTGTLVAGDVVTFAGDTNKYVIASGDADVSNGGTITLAAPGLRVAMSAATKAITVVAAAARNMAWTRNALVLALRAPARPSGGDTADDIMFINDPVSGLAFELASYPMYRQRRWELAAAWGVKNTKPEHTALLLG